MCEVCWLSDYVESCPAARVVQMRQTGIVSVLWLVLALQIVLKLGLCSVLGEANHVEIYHDMSWPLDTLKMHWKPRLQCKVHCGYIQPWEPPFHFFHFTPRLSNISQTRVLRLSDIYSVCDGLCSPAPDWRELLLFHQPCKFKDVKRSSWGWRKLPSHPSAVARPYFIGKRNGTTCPAS